MLLTSCASPELVKTVTITKTVYMPQPQMFPTGMSNPPSVIRDEYEDYDWTDIDEEIAADHASRIVKMPSYDLPRAEIETEVPLEANQEEFEGVQ